LRFLLDEDVNPTAAEVARGLGLDALSVHEVDRRGLSDSEQLQWAAREARILVTRNRDDFILLTVERFRTGEAHPGVLIVSRSLPNDQPERIARALAGWATAAAGVETLAYVIDFLGGV
jgi:predicted nuclease of predicted toxin-antitoxin system